MNAAGPLWAVSVLAFLIGVLTAQAGRRTGRAAVALTAVGLLAGAAAPLAAPVLTTLVVSGRHRRVARGVAAALAAAGCWTASPWLAPVAVLAPWAALAVAAVGTWQRRGHRRSGRVVGVVAATLSCAFVGVVTFGIVRLLTAAVDMRKAFTALGDDPSPAAAAVLSQRAELVADRLDSVGMHLLTVVPGASPYARAAVDAATYARAASSEASSLLAEWERDPLLAPGPTIDAQASHTAAGRLARIGAATHELSAVTAELGENPFTFTPVAELASDSISRFEDLSQAASTAGSLVEVAAKFTERPTRLLLLAVNPAEARGTGGVIGGYGIVSTDGRTGRWQLAAVGRVADLNEALAGRGDLSQVPELSGPLGSFGVADEWRNLTMGADGVAVARAAAVLAPQSGIGQVDGTVVVSPEMLAALLTWSGPVRVASWPEPVTDRTAARIIEQDQYDRFVDAGSASRDLFLVELLRATWTKLGSVEGLPGAVALRGVADAIDRQHLTMWASDPELDALLGAVPQVRRLDGLTRQEGVERFAVVFNNAAANKLDPHLDRVVDIDVPSSGEDVLTATVTLTNRAGPDLPIWVLGAGDADVPSGLYRAWLTFISDRPLLDVTVDGTKVVFEHSCQAGASASSGYVRIRPGTSRKVVATFGPGPDARAVDVVAQPGPQNRVSHRVNGVTTAGTVRLAYTTPATSKVPSGCILP